MTAQLFGQPKSISGTVLNKEGQAVEHAIVWVSDLDTIFYADQHGQFSVPASGEKHFLKITAPGYASKNAVLPFNFNESLLIYLEQNIQDEYFNPYEVIRIAGLQREKNRQNYTAYQATTFKASSVNLINVPFQLPLASGLLLPSKGDTGIMFYSEQLCKQHYQNPNSFTDSTVAFRAGGILAAPDFNYVTDKSLSFYNEFLSIEELNHKKYFSPLGSKAAQLYDFKAMGTYMDGQRKIYRISFHPKKPGTPAIKGYLELYDSSFTVAYADYRFLHSNHLETVDSLSVKQYYTYQKNQYRQLYTKLKHYINIVGFKGYYTSESYFLKHQFEPVNEELHLGYNVYHLDVQAIGKKSKTLEGQVPRTLSSLEAKLLKENNLNNLFREKYSRNMVVQQEFRAQDLWFKGYIYREDKLFFNLPPLYYTPNYNTVEGFVLNYKVPIAIYQPETEWRITPMARYGFADNEFKSRVSAEFTYDLDNPKRVSLEVGHVFDQFNEEDPIHPAINSFYTLFLGKNYMKLYGKDYIKAGYKLELADGLELQSSLEYADRYPVYNNTDFTIIGEGQKFTPNNPTKDDVINEQGFDRHHALTFRAQLAYQFDQQYKTINGKKINLQMKTPRIYMNFRQGLSFLGGDTRFIFLGGGVTFNTDAKRLGHTRWDFSTGSFIARSHIEFIDYQHFNGTQTFYLQPSSYYSGSIKQFSTLGYYDYSTAKSFIEGHIEHHFDGALLSKWKLTRKTGIHSFMGLNYLYNFDQHQFVELFIGITNIMDIFKIEIATPIRTIEGVTPTLLVGVNFNFLYYQQNKR